MPRHRRFITRLGELPEPPENFPLTPFVLGFAAASEFRFPPSPPRNNRHLEWLAAVLLHVAIIALALITFEPPMELAPPGQTAVSVVFENPGAQQTTAPRASLHGPPIVAEAPPTPSASPPPPQPQPAPPETDLQIPQDLFSQFELPPAAPQPEQQAQTARPTHPYSKPVRHPYQVMNDMSLGNSSSGTPSPRLSNAQPGLNLQLSQSDLNALDRPEIQVQGQIGSNWMNGFNKWVNDHTYYPQAAVEQSQQGTSVIEFTVHRDGSVTGLRLLSSAGSPFLDQAWLGIFAQNKVPPFPRGTKSDSVKITASLQYELVP